MRRTILLTLFVLAFTSSVNSQILQEFNAFFDETEVTPGIVRLELTDDFGSTNLVLNVEVPNLASYIGRPKIGARTGGATADQDVGDVTIEYFSGDSSTTLVYPADPAVANGPRTLSNNSLPMSLGDGFTRVAYQGELGTEASIAWDTVFTNGWDHMRVTMPIRIQAGTPENDLADGIGFSYVRESVHGNAGVFYSGGEEPSASGVGIGFDIWDNGGEGPASVSAHFNGLLLESVDIYNNDNWLFKDELLGRTVLESGEPLTAVIDIISTVDLTDPPTVIGGSPFTAAATRSAATGGLLPAQDGNLTGSVNGFYRLTEAVNDQGNYIAFDQVANAGSRPVLGARTGASNEQADIDSVRTDFGPGTVNASFDFRLTNVIDVPADGLSFTLARTDIHGTNGEVSQVVDQFNTTGVDWAVAEDPRLAGSLGFGFKTYQANEFRIRYDGDDIANIASSSVGFPDGFADGQWHSANVSVRDMGNDALVSVRLDELQVFSGVIPNASGLGLRAEWRFVSDFGGTPQDWFDNATWEMGVPPSASDNVVFDLFDVPPQTVVSATQLAEANVLRVVGSSIDLQGDYRVNETMVEHSVIRTDGDFSSNIIAVELSTFTQQSGTVRVTDLTLSTGLYQLDGGVLDLQGGTLNMSEPADFLMQPAGELRNAGAITSSFEHSHGVLSPGDNNNSVGITTIDGSYHQGIDAILEVDIIDGTHDSILVANTAILDGQLRIKLDTEPNAGDRFIILASEAADENPIQGSFSLLTMDQSSDLASHLIVNSHTVEIEFVNPAIQQNTMSGIFHSGDNWATGRVPNEMDDVEVVNNILLTQAATVHDLVIQTAGASVAGEPGIAFSSTGGVVVEEGTELTSVDETWTLFTPRVTVNGILSGNMTVDGEIVVDSGLIAPGKSSGVITSTGDLTHGDNSSTKIEVSNNTSDRISVAGTATLAGSLEVIFFDGYDGPGIAGEIDRYAFLTAGEIVGKYDIGSGFIDNGLFFETVGTRTSMEIAIRRTLDGDANGDGNINAQDLNSLGIGWQKAGTWESGDFDGDGFVDASDLNVIALGWRASVNAIAVPEPATLPMSILALLVVCLFESRRRAC